MAKDQIDALIIESDLVSLEQLVSLLQSYPVISNIETASDTDAALLKVLDLNPELVFLEYPVRGKTGKKIIQFIQSKLPETTFVFVSKSTKYALDAIRYEVYNYLLKPILKVELDKIIGKIQPSKQTNFMTLIDEIVDKQQDDHRVQIATTRGFRIISPNEILFCKADGPYTEIHFTNKSKELAYMFLSKVEKSLVPYNFVRVSRSTIVNKTYIRKVYPNTDTLVLLAEGEEYDIKGSRLSIRALGRTENE